MPKQTLTDREMLTDALSSEKFMTENYNTYANECASPLSDERIHESAFRRTSDSA